MKAAVLEGKNTINIKNLNVPRCQVGQVLVKVKSCGICRTDMKCYSMGQRDLKLPRVLGHEITGVIEEVGKGVKQHKKGDRVQISPGITCGKCDFCKKGLDNLCTKLEIMGFNYDGGFAEYLLIPAVAVENGVINTISKETSFEEASMTEPLACSINMLEQVGQIRGKTILVFGAGRLGLLNIKLARLAAAEKVILVEINEHRLAEAKKYEVDYLIDGRKNNVVETVSNITKGKGADIAVTCCPSYEAMNQGLYSLAKRGKMAFFSGLIKSETSPIDLNLIHYKELNVLGGYGCSVLHSKKALQLIESGKITVKDMITKIITLEDVEKGIKMVQDMSELSIIVNY